MKECQVCGGLGYFRCECWPGDCICAVGDEDCDECEGDGFIDEDAANEAAYDRQQERLMESGGPDDSAYRRDMIAAGRRRLLK